MFFLHLGSPQSSRAVFGQTFVIELKHFSLSNPFILKIYFDFLNDFTDVLLVDILVTGGKHFSALHAEGQVVISFFDIFFDFGELSIDPHPLSKTFPPTVFLLNKGIKCNFGCFQADYFPDALSYELDVHSLPQLLIFFFEFLVQFFYCCILN